MSAPDRYGDDPELTRATWRAFGGVALAGLATAACVVVAAAFFFGKGFLFFFTGASEVATHLHVPVVVVLAFVACVMVVVAWRGQRPLRGALRPGPPLPAEHPAHGMLQRLCVLADMPVPPLATVALVGANAMVLQDDEGSAVLCLTPLALTSLAPDELEAVLAHELFHVAHGDVGLTERLERLAAVARARTFASVSDRVAGSVARLLRQRELSADRAAALLTGRPSSVVAALRRCTPDVPLPSDLDLRAVTRVAFVSAPARVGPSGHGGRPRPSPPTHPTLTERTESLARVANQLGRT